MNCQKLNVFKIEKQGIKRLILCLVILCVSIYVKAQDIQQIHQELSQTTDDAQKPHLLWQLGKLYHKEKAYAKALDYFEQALENGKDFLSNDIQILICKDIISVSEYLKKHEISLKSYQYILSLQDELGDSVGKLNTYHKIAALYEIKGNTQEALALYLTLSEHYFTRNDYPSLIKSYNNIGYLYQKNQQSQLSNKFYFEAIDYLNQCPECLNADEKSVLYLNVGTNFAALKNVVNAEKYFNKALELQKANPIKTAEIHSYMAVNYLLNKKSLKAISSFEESIALIQNEKDNPLANNILLKNYQLMADLYEGEDNKLFQRYTNLYLNLQEYIRRIEQESQIAQFNEQLTVEMNENRMLTLLREKVNAENKNSQLENAAQEKELLLKTKELDLLKRSQELQQAQIHNQLLEKEKMSQILRMAEQDLENENQKRNSIHQQLIAEQIKAENSRQQKELLEALKEKALQAQQLEQAETQSKLRLSIIFLMILLLALSLILVIYFNYNRKAIKKQHNYIQQQHKEIEIKNIHITKQNGILKEKQNEIKRYAEKLEQLVQERTSQLVNVNQELVKNNQQLEQFGYIVAHNLRGPVARLLGLGQIFKFAEGDESEREFVVSKIQQEIQVLDGVITDLNIILKIKNGIENNIERISLDERIEAVLEGIKAEVTETGTIIRYDFSKAQEVSFIQPYMHSIFYNLISNAIKYRSPDRKPEILLETSIIDNDIICLKVKDNGLGMDLKQHGKNIFGLYKRFHLHKEGKGIGLYLVKTQLEILGGKIEIESEPDKGTTFYLYFNNSVSKKVEEKVLAS